MYKPLIPQPNQNMGYKKIFGVPYARTVQYQNEPATTTPQATEGTIGGYDIAKGWRAADPNHMANVQAIYSQLQNSTSTIQQDIDRVSALQGTKSPLTEKMINYSATQYGVDPKMMAAIIRADTNYGIHNLTPYNPSNVGTYGTNKVKFNNWQQGSDETARFLSTIKTGNNRTFTGLNDLPKGSNPI